MLMFALKFQAAFEKMVEVDKPYKVYFKEEENGKKNGEPTWAWVLGKCQMNCAVF